MTKHLKDMSLSELQEGYENGHITKQEKYEYVSKKLDGTDSELFAYWLSAYQLDLVFELVMEWQSHIQKRPNILTTPKLKDND